MDKISDLKDCVEKISKDAYKFFNKNNKASGVRVRKKLQKCKKIAQEIRILIQKSKQEQVQKKESAVAAAIAASAGNLLNQEDSKISEISITNNEKINLEPIQLKTKINTQTPIYNNSIDFFFDGNSKNEEDPKVISGLEARTRLDDIPTWNEERTKMF